MIQALPNKAYQRLIKSSTPFPQGVCQGKLSNKPDQLAFTSIKKGEKIIVKDLVEEDKPKKIFKIGLSAILATATAMGIGAGIMNLGRIKEPPSSPAPQEQVDLSAEAIPNTEMNQATRVITNEIPSQEKEVITNPDAVKCDDVTWNRIKIDDSTGDLRIVQAGRRPQELPQSYLERFDTIILDYCGKQPMYPMTLDLGDSKDQTIKLANLPDYPNYLLKADTTEDGTYTVRSQIDDQPTALRIVGNPERFDILFRQLTFSDEESYTDPTPIIID